MEPNASPPSGCCTGPAPSLPTPAAPLRGTSRGQASALEAAGARARRSQAASGAGQRNLGPVDDAPGRFGDSTGLAAGARGLGAAPEPGAAGWGRLRPVKSPGGDLTGPGRPAGRDVAPGARLGLTGPRRICLCLRPRRLATPGGAWRRRRFTAARPGRGGRRLERDELLRRLSRFLRVPGAAQVP